jgi:RimJ/RimL family protein N-acetyltransferase
MIAASDDDAPLGLITLRDVDWVNRTAMFGLWIAPEAQGNGVGKSATAQMIDVAFGRLNLRKLSLDVLASNERAIAMYAGLGFTQEGRFIDQVSVDGVGEDVIRMGLINS